jgi:hypothetical protein
MATITDLNSGDDGATSRGVINTNFDNLNTDKLEAADLPSASESAEGMVELATDAEALAGSSDSVVLTPGNLGYTGFLTGWIPSSDTWTYSSVDDPTGVVTVNADLTGVLSAGMRIKFTNNSQTVYGIITKTPTYSSPNTTVTFLHEIDPSDSQALHLMQNSAITAPYYSHQKAPFGFPLEIDKWSVISEDTTRRSNTSTPSVYSACGSSGFSIPIGSWDVYASCSFGVICSSNGEAQCYVALSTSASSVSDSRYIKWNDIRQNEGADGRSIAAFVIDAKLTLASKTTYYLIGKSNMASATSVNFFNDFAPTVIIASCAYL